MKLMVLEKIHNCQRFCKIEYNIDFKRNIKENNLELNLELLDLITTQITTKQIKVREIYELAQKRNHKVLKADYRNAQSKLEIFCIKHNTTHSTTFTNYKKSKTGCFCCGHDRNLNLLS